MYAIHDDVYVYLNRNDVRNNIFDPMPDRVDYNIRTNSFGTHHCESAYKGTRVNNLHQMEQRNPKI